MSPTRRTTASQSSTEIATIRIELRGSDPAIWREVEVPTSITLTVLHHVIQAAMGWEDDHLWAFTIDKQRYGLPMDGYWGWSGDRMPARCACGMSFGRAGRRSTTSTTSATAGSIG